MPSSITAAAATASHGPRRFMSRRVLLRVRRGSMGNSVLYLRHARACRGHPRFTLPKQDVDGRDKPGHDRVVGLTSCAYENTPESIWFQKLLRPHARVSPPWLRVSSPWLSAGK